MNETARQLLAEVARLGAAIDRAHYKLRQIMWLAESAASPAATTTAVSDGSAVAVLERAR